MGDATTTSPSPTKALFRYGVPDLSVASEDRSLFSFPPNKEIKEVSQTLHNARDSPDILPGAAGLDTQGFTYIKHQSALSETGPLSWYTGTNVEDTYLPEVAQLIRDLTGAKTAVVNNVAFRRQPGDTSTAPAPHYKRGDPFDLALAQLPKDHPVAYGKDAAHSMPPFRTAHIDYSPQGLRDTIRHCRADITAAARPALAALDSGPATPVPRYAAYSVWRPLRTVTRDPLAVLDVRTLDPADLLTCEYRALSNVTPSGEYTMGATVVLPPRAPDAHRWYYMPRQGAEDVLVIKFADSAAGQALEGSADSVVAGGCPHLSPIVEGPEYEDAETRASIEVRVIAFW